MADTAPGSTPAAGDDPGFGVYVHWPFCRAKCPYCDFNSHVRHAGVDQGRYADALVRELALLAARTPGRTVSTVFFGGGTPSLMQPRTVATVLDAIGRCWTVAADVEVTLECNPTSAEAAAFAGYRAAGVNRLSVGVQALDDRALARLGRQHTVAEALAAYAEAARRFERTSFDLIYARPGQAPGEWRDELGRALAVAGGHLSLYQLTIEPGTAYAELARAGRLRVPGDRAAAALYELTLEMCDRAGRPAYEISNHAVPGDECRHNLLYWRYGEYVGAGPGAHSRIVDGAGRIALCNERHPETWLEAIERGRPETREERLTAAEQADEMLLMGLRIAEGVDLARHARLGGAPLSTARIERLARDGLVDFDAAAMRLKLTARGSLLLDAIAVELASDPERPAMQ